MAMAERTANCAWDGDLPHGSGKVSGASGALGELPVTWASRTERSDGKTSPEELIAAAHASCYSMALSHGLGEAGTPPEHLDVAAKVTLDLVNGAPTVTKSELTVTAMPSGEMPVPARFPWDAKPPERTAINAVTPNRS